MPIRALSYMIAKGFFGKSHSLSGTGLHRIGTVQYKENGVRLSDAEVIRRYKKKYPGLMNKPYGYILRWLRKAGSVRGLAQNLATISSGSDYTTWAKKYVPSQIGRKGSSNRKRKKSNPLKQFNYVNPLGGELVAQAMKNGIIVRLDPLEYPIFMEPGAFVMETKKGKKSGGFDVSVFMRQNNITKRPNKSTVIAELKKGLRNMTLTYYLLNSSEFFPSGSWESNEDNDQKFMGTTTQQAAPFYDLYMKTFNAKMAKYTNQGQKDAALAKAYSQAILDLAPFISTMSKMLSKDPALKKYHQRIAKINPLDFKSAPKRKGKTTTKKSTTTDKQAKSTQEILRLAREYNKGGARGKYSKFKAKYGVRNTDKIKRQAEALRKKASTPSKKPSKPTRKRLPMKTSVRYQRKKDRNGRFLHYKIDKNGKKTRISKSDYQKKKK